MIRNIHYEDILKNTYSGIENNPTFMKVLYDLYINRIIDYKILTPSAIHYIMDGRIGSVFSSFYFRASIMNPYLVYSLNKSLLKDIISNSQDQQLQSSIQNLEYAFANAFPRFKRGRLFGLSRQFD